MKNLIALTVLLLVGLNLFAQKPVANDNQLTAGFTPGSGTNTFLMLRHYTKDNTAIRYGLGWAYSHSINQNVNQQQGEQNTSNITSGNLSASIGLQKSIKSPIDKLEPYIGLDVVVSNTSSSYLFKSTITDTITYNSNNYIGDYNSNLNKNPLSLGAALRPVLGANYYFNSNWGLGIEYRINSILSGTYSYGGKTVDDYKYQGVLTHYQTSDEKGYAVNTSFSGSLYVTLSYKLNKGN